MSSIPLPALHLNQPEQNSPLDSMRRAVSLQNLMQQNKMGKMELEEAQAAKKDRDLLQQVWTEKGGDLDAALEEAPKRGVRVATVEGMKTQRAKRKEEMLRMKEQDFKTLQERNKLISGAVTPLTQIPEGPEGDAQLMQGAAQTLQGLVQQGVLSPQEAQQYAPILQQPPAQVRQALKQLSLAGVSADEQFKAIEKQRADAAAAQARRDERTANEKDFQAYYQNYLAANELKPNAKIERTAREDFRQEKRGAAPTATFGGNRYQWNPATNKYDIKLGPDKGEGGGTSQGQRAAAERWKQGQIRTLRSEALRRQQAADRGEPNAEAMGEEEFRNRWQDIQDSYEGQLASEKHMEIPGSMARENLPGRAGAVSATLGARHPAPNVQAEPVAAHAGRGRLSVEQAAEYLRRAGGDKTKARAMAKADGWEF